MKVKFVHPLLSSEKMNFQIKDECFYFKNAETCSILNNHYLTCNRNERNKTLRIQKLISYLKLLNRPPQKK